MYNNPIEKRSQKRGFLRKHVGLPVLKDADSFSPNALH